MKQITEQQIRERANEIGSRPAFPVSHVDTFDAHRTFLFKGMTYKMWLIGQWIASGDAFIPQVNEYASEALYYIAKAELEAEQEVQGE